MAATWLRKAGDIDFNGAADLNRDNAINNMDSDILSANFNTVGTGVVTIYYYHFDGSGNVIALSDSSGNTVETYAYNVFGRVDTAGSVKNPYFFTGRRFDTETGLYYYRARYYDSAIGRFLQTDPVGYNDSLNLYQYALNNPLSFIDPWGMCAEDTSWKQDSLIATALTWGDVLGLSGEFGQRDTYDPEIIDAVINPYPNAGEPGAIADETFWDSVHVSSGIALALVGVNETSASNILQTWESTEPGIWSVWGLRLEYQGRNVFEGGQVGIDRDMTTGMGGYEYGRSLRD